MRARPAHRECNSLLRADLAGVLRAIGDTGDGKRLTAFGAFVAAATVNASTRGNAGEAELEREAEALAAANNGLF